MMSVQTNFPHTIDRLEAELYRLNILDENPTLSTLKDKATGVGKSTQLCVDSLKRNGLIFIANMNEVSIDPELFSTMKKSFELFNSFRELFQDILPQIETKLQNIKIQYKEKKATDVNEFNSMSTIFEILRSLESENIDLDIKNIFAENKPQEVLENERIELEQINLIDSESSYIFNKIVKINKIAEFALTKFLNAAPQEKTEWLELFTDACELTLLANTKMNQFLVELATQLKNQNPEPGEEEIDTIQKTAKLFQSYFVQNNVK